MVPPIFAGEEDKGPLEFVRFVFEKVKGKKRPQRPPEAREGLIDTG